MKQGRQLIALLCLLALGLPLAGAAAPPGGGRMMAITFDDLPFVHIEQFDAQRLHRQTSLLLTALGRAGIEAIGFVNEHKLYHRGEVVPSRLALLQQWLDAGMELGNHTHSHLSLNRAGTAAFEADILRGERLTRELTRARGLPLRYFRHPFLHVGQDLQQRREVERFLHAHGYTVAPVTVISQEWQYAAAYDNAQAQGDQAALERIGKDYIDHMQQAVDHAEALAREMFGRNVGQVMLLHANMLNADHLPELIAALRERGYRFAPLAEVLQDRAYRAPDTYTAASGESWLGHWLLSAGLRPRSGPRCPDFVRRWAGTNGYRGD